MSYRKISGYMISICECQPNIGLFNYFKTSYLIKNGIFMVPFKRCLSKTSKNHEDSSIQNKCLN